MCDLVRGGGIILCWSICIMWQEFIHKHHTTDFLRNVFETLPEAQRTQAIESYTWIISEAKSDTSSSLSLFYYLVFTSRGGPPHLMHLHVILLRLGDLLAHNLQKYHEITNCQNYISKIFIRYLHRHVSHLVNLHVCHLIGHLVNFLEHELVLLVVITNRQGLLYWLQQ